MMILKIRNGIIYCAGLVLLLMHCASLPQPVWAPPSPAGQDGEGMALEEFEPPSDVFGKSPMEYPTNGESVGVAAEAAGEPEDGRNEPPEYEAVYEPESLITSREFLISGEQEAPGFGLYSYILFGSKAPDGEIKEIHLAAIQAYLLIMPVEDRVKGAAFDTSEINITYLPIMESLDPQITVPAEQAEWLLNHYDYNTADRIILTMLEEELDGPFIISAFDPLGGLYERPPGNALVQYLPPATPDLNPGTPGWNPDAAAKLAYGWVKEFRATASRERFKKNNDLRRFLEAFQTILVATAEAIPPIVEAMDNLSAKIKGWVQIWS